MPASSHLLALTIFITGWEGIATAPLAAIVCAKTCEANGTRTKMRFETDGFAPKTFGESSHVGRGGSPDWGGRDALSSRRTRCHFGITEWQCQLLGLENIPHR
ncbi:hypothetical protein B0T14DRAFT_104152 [Immersiella caudata]|uniref:Secreted protein n=1 Tax=Immersiella caudata TaxID=314043 RepID=A0AA39X3F0_9PEZI|nr:hypothetical protein B0T14DRAFT_104152 [Immersiella caudata]